MISEISRRYAYWVIDFLRGSKVRKHYNDIKYIIENNDETASIRERYLNDILNYAVKTTPFYKRYDNYNKLSDFPIINKNIIKENYADFQSEEYINSKVFKLHTSGSTGTPFEIREDMNKRYRMLAEQIYYGEKAGYFIGMRYIFFRVWTDINTKPKLVKWATNLVQQDIVRLDDDSLSETRKLLHEDKKIKFLLGYASTFENLANYLIRCGDTPDKFNVEAIVSGSEVLTEDVREKLIQVFGCSVVSRYSNQENGMLAQECKEKHEFHINNASYVIELLKIDRDEPAEVGEEGRIVVTDLFNYAMPFIRYDTGDIGVMKKNSECGLSTPVLENISGRVVDFIYDTSGNRLSPYMLTNYMWPFDKLKQFQFIQEDKTKYILKLNGAKKFYKDEEFIDLFKEFLGQDAQIKIEHVNQVPVLKSGKFKKVVCNYKPLNMKVGD